MAMKKILTIIVLFWSIASTQAQETTIWQKALLFLTQTPNIDTTRIYQPKTGFYLGVFTTGQKAGFDVDANFDIGLDGTRSINGISSYRLSENPCKKIGLEAGYGKLNLGYGVEVGHRSASKKRTLAFNILGQSWGVHMKYYKISNPFNIALTIGNEGDENYLHNDYHSDQLASMRSFTLDGYYVFNNKRFAFPAAYKKSLVQRRTAGSWMLTARYMQGDLINSPEASIFSYNLLDCFSTMQASVGGGYSANFVLWHKDPNGTHDKGLRNLTLNLTAMPVLTLFNYLKTTEYEYDENGEYCGDKVAKTLCYPMPNFIGSAAASLTMGKFYFTAQFSYNRFYFRSSDALNASHLNHLEYLDKLDYSGTFHDWTLKGLLVYSF